VAVAFFSGAELVIELQGHPAADEQLSHSSERNSIMTNDPTPLDATPHINREQIEIAYKAAEQQITAAIHAFALQLPQGTLYEQEAVNAAGALLDQLLRRTGQYDEAAQFQPGTPPNPDLAARRAALAGVEESDEVKDFNSGG
jgi:hypothetical protein